MKAITAQIDHGIDPIAIGAQGALWKDTEMTLAGVGEAARIPIDRAGGGDAAQKAQETLASISLQNEGQISGNDLVAFAAFPFDPKLPGELVIPRILLRSLPNGALSITAVSEGDLSVEAAIEEIASQVSHSDMPTSTRSVIKSVIPPNVWRDELVTDVINRIQGGQLEKMVLAREIQITSDVDLNVPQVVKNLVATNPNAMVFSIDKFVGASPELLISRKGDVVQANPLAGTAIRLADEDEDMKSMDFLLESVKDQYEHKITIEWLLNELLPFCSYIDADPEPRIVSLPNVHHLATKVHGHLSTPAASVLELVSALHPTPAVAGKPQAEAINLITQIEKDGRGKYAGPVGWVDANGNGAFAVGIRSAQISGNQANLFAGVGIVADSDPQSELDETDGKFLTMQQAIMPTIS
ncbi:MAG: isochorismate synthase [Actinomycetota bacterium]|nr:isochorismate synthase [Actinomycetota bacterium]